MLLRSLRSKAIWWFIGAEAALLGVFFWLVGVGRSAAGLAVLALPLQIVLLAVLSRRNLWLLAFVVATLPLTALGLLPGMYRELFIYVAALGTLAVFLATGRYFGDTTPVPRLHRAEKLPMLLFALLLLASSAHAYFRGWSSVWTLRATLWALQMTVFVWATAVVPTSLDDIRRLLFLAAAVYVGCCFVLPFIGLYEGGDVADRKILLAPFDHVNLNAFAAHVAVCSVILVALTAEARGWQRLLLAAGAAVLLGALVFCRSRGAWLGFGLAFIYIVFSIRSLSLTVAAAILIAAMLSQEVFRSSLMTRFEATTVSDPSLLGRLLLWRYGLDVGSRNWLLGVGFENFRHLKAAFGFPGALDPLDWYNTHNIYVEMFAGLGLAGVASWLWLKVGTFARLTRSAARTPDAKALATGLGAAIIAYGIHGLFDSLTYQPSSLMLPGLVLGLSMAAIRLTSGKRSVALSSSEPAGR